VHAIVSADFKLKFLQVYTLDVKLCNIITFPIYKLKVTNYTKSTPSKTRQASAIAGAIYVKNHRAIFFRYFKELLKIKYSKLISAGKKIIASKTRQSRMDQISQNIYITVFKCTSELKLIIKQVISY